MTTQLPLELDRTPPTSPATISAFHVRSEMSLPEALAGERVAGRQDRRVLEIFEARRGAALTPSQVRGLLCEETDRPAPLLTSVRRSITNLCKREKLLHHPKDRRPGPHGSRESTWSLA